MHAAKLLEVADMLDKLPNLMGPADRLNMNEWVGTNYVERPDGQGTICGTAACVAGWTVKLLPHLGLDICNYAVRFTAPDGQRSHEYNALRRCFDIPYNDARRLFGYENPNDPAALSKMIRTYVAANLENPECHAQSA